MRKKSECSNALKTIPGHNRPKNVLPVAFAGDEYDGNYLADDQPSLPTMRSVQRLYGLMRSEVLKDLDEAVQDGPARVRSALKLVTKYLECATGTVAAEESFDLFHEVGIEEARS